jgi:recombination protein RecR
MLHIPALEKLVHELGKLPGIGPKTAQRLAYHILRTGGDYTKHLNDALARVQMEVHECPSCFNYTDLDICRYCQDPHRNDELICIVEEPSDIVRIESTGVFRGRYHVLHGVIAPLEGVSPHDLKIKELLQKVDQGVEGTRPLIKEIILALDSDLEGDTTTLYLAKQLSTRNIRLSRIAQGIPIGSDIDYIDERTMGRALENRVEL